MSDMPSSTWYVDFFTELPNEFWRRAVPPKATEAEVDFIERHLGLQPRSRIVDVPCGSGRHTLALAARGHRLTGVDISTEAIGYARRAAADVHLDVELIVAEMREIPRDGSFDAAVCMGNSFGYLNLAGTREFVAALAGAIRPGGGLVIDFTVAAESLVYTTCTPAPSWVICSPMTGLPTSGGTADRPASPMSSAPDGCCSPHAGQNVHNGP